MSTDHPRPSSRLGPLPGPLPWEPIEAVLAKSLHQMGPGERMLPAWNFLPSASTTSRFSPASALSSTCPGLRAELVALLGALNAAQPVSVRRVVGNPDFASFLHDQLHCFSAHAQVHFELGAHNR